MDSGLPLRQLVGGLNALSVCGPLDATVAALAYDPRRVVPGSLFFAVSRSGADDGPPIPRAIERGAAAIVCEEAGHVPYVRATRIRVANCRNAMAAAAAAFFGHPSRHLQVAVITGCPARGPVASLVHQILSATGTPTGWAGGRGCRVGERRLPPLASEPEALDLQELLASMVRTGCRLGLIELSPRASAQAALTGTNIGAMFVTELIHGSPSALVPQHTRPQGEGAVWRLTDLTTQVNGHPGRLTLQIESGHDRPWRVEARCRRATATSTCLEVTTPWGSFACRLPLPGREQARAGLAAAAIALALGVAPPDVAAALERVGRVPGSLEPVRNTRGFQVLVDAASSACELDTVLQDVRRFATGRVLLLFGCGSRHAADERVAMGEVAARGADLAILTSDSPGWESPGVIAAHVASGFVRGRGVPPRIVPDRVQAIRELLREARRGDCVVLSGKGHRTVQEQGGCVLPFDDRLHASAALKELDPAPATAEAPES